MECCTHHRNDQRAAVIPDDDADSDMGCVIGGDRIAAAEEHMFAHRLIYFKCSITLSNLYLTSRYPQPPPRLRSYLLKQGYPCPCRC